MIHVAIITNIPAPYRVDFFEFLENNYKNYRFTVIYSSKNEDNRKWEIESEKIKNSIFLESKTLKIKKRFDTKYIHFPVGVGKVLDQIKPDVVVGSEYNPTIIQALLYCQRRKIPFVSWTDGTLFSERNINIVQKLLRKYVISKASSYIASSTKSKEAQIAYGAKTKNCHISMLAVDVEKYKQTSKASNRGKIICVGSLIERKGVDLLLSALSAMNTEFELYLAGDGDEKNNLKKLAEKLRIDKNVHFLGQLNRNKLLNYYADSDLFVLPTREDCFALVILEAMCSELPVVCSKYADGAYDLIEEGKNGFIIDPYNTENFAKVMEDVLKDSELRAKMRKSSKEVIEKFQFKEIAKGYISAIEDCL